jgi:hypothetical protein
VFDRDDLVRVGGGGVRGDDRVEPQQDVLANGVDQVDLGSDALSRVLLLIVP